ncbi:hypothetical protein DFS34DRAFT_234462 [Phlyctochytrium arcticum]|nr:hypothetical protein DFS34DRAFT_234462 [Phlyctochytrium arcticum]
MDGKRSNAAGGGAVGAILMTTTTATGAGAGTPTTTTTTTATSAQAASSFNGAATDLVCCGIPMTIDQFTRHREHGHGDVATPTTGTTAAAVATAPATDVKQEQQQQQQQQSPIHRSQSDPMLSMPRSAYPYSPTDHLSPQYPVLPASPPTTNTSAGTVVQQLPTLPNNNGHPPIQHPHHTPAALHIISPNQPHHPPPLQQHQPNMYFTGQPQLIPHHHPHHPHLQQSQHHPHHLWNSGFHSSISLPNLATGDAMHMFHHQPSPASGGMPTTPLYSTFEDILSSTYQSQNHTPAEVEQHHPIPTFSQAQQHQAQQQHIFNVRQQQQQYMRFNQQQQQTWSNGHPGAKNGGGPNNASLPTPPFSAVTANSADSSRAPPPLAPPTSPSDCSTAASDAYSIEYQDPRQHPQHFSSSYDDLTHLPHTNSPHHPMHNEPSASSYHNYLSPRMDQMLLPSGTVTPSSTWSSPAPSIPTSPIPSRATTHTLSGTSTPSHPHQQQQQQQQPGQQAVPRVYRCFIPDCPKTYSTGAGLRYHLRHFHKMSQIPRQPPIRTARIKPDFYPCLKCSKQYSTAAGLRYHKKTFTHPEDVAAGLVKPASTAANKDAAAAKYLVMQQQAAAAAHHQQQQQQMYAGVPYHEDEEIDHDDGYYPPPPQQHQQQQYHPQEQYQTWS